MSVVRVCSVCFCIRFILCPTRSGWGCSRLRPDPSDRATDRRRVFFLLLYCCGRLLSGLVWGVVGEVFSFSTLSTDLPNRTTQGRAPPFHVRQPTDLPPSCRSCFFCFWIGFILSPLGSALTDRPTGRPVVSCLVSLGVFLFLEVFLGRLLP